MRFVIFHALCLGLIGGPLHAGSPHQDPGALPDSKNHPQQNKKTYPLRERDEKGDEVIVESAERCLVRTKNGVKYLYDIATGEVIWIPDWTVTDVTVTQNRKEDERNDATDSSEFSFRLAPSPESLAEYKKLKEIFPKAKKIDLTGAKVRFSTRDWDKPISEREIHPPKKLQLREATDEQQRFHFELDAKDAGFLLALEEAKGRFPITVESKTPCAESRPDIPLPVVFNPDTKARQIIHYEREEKFIYPAAVIEPVQKLLKTLSEERENPEKELATARKILQTYANSPTSKDREMVKALGYPNFDAAIDDVLKRPRARNNLAFAMNFYCAGKMSCLANLLYSSRIESMKKPQHFSKKDLKIDILNPEEWEKLVRAESYDEVKVFEKFKNDRTKVLAYTTAELANLEKIYNLPDKKILRSVLVDEWDPAQPDKGRKETKFETIR